MNQQVFDLPLPIRNSVIRDEAIFIYSRIIEIDEMNLYLDHYPDDKQNILWNDVHSSMRFHGGHLTDDEAEKVLDIIEPLVESFK